MGAQDGEGALWGLRMIFEWWDQLEVAGLLIHAWVDGQMGGILARGSHNAGDVVSSGFYLAIRLWS